MTLSELRALANNSQIQAIFHVIGRGETSAALTEEDYRTMYGGKLFDAPPWRHPYHGRTTTEVGHSTACGFAQFLGTTWAEIDRALGLGGDFSPESQRIGACWLIAVKRNALTNVLAGDMEGVLSKLHDEWTSLPQIGVDEMQRVFRRYGGSLSGETQPAAPIEDHSPANLPPVQPRGTTVPILAILSAFGPALASLIPQLAKLFAKPDSEIAQRNVSAIELALDTIVKATQGPEAQATMATVAQAVEAMKADKAVKQQVVTAVVNEPGIMEMLEFNEKAIKAAAERNISAASIPLMQDRAFLLALLFMAGCFGVAFVVLLGNFSQDLKTQVAITVIGILVVVAAFYYGSSASSQRKTEVAAQGKDSAI